MQVFALWWSSWLNFKFLNNFICFLIYGRHWDCLNHRAGGFSKQWMSERKQQRGRHYPLYSELNQLRHNLTSIRRVFCLPCRSSAVNSACTCSSRNFSGDQQWDGKKGFLGASLCISSAPKGWQRKPGGVAIREWTRFDMPVAKSTNNPSALCPAALWNKNVRCSNNNSLFSCDAYRLLWVARDKLINCSTAIALLLKE